MKHTIAVAGLGNRGRIHIKGILENPGRFELAGVFDPSPESVQRACEQFGIKSGLVYSSAEEMLEKTKPEVLVFVTHPDIRRAYVDMAIKYGVKCISFEKPMALSIADARAMTRSCVDKGVKAVVSHQQKYLRQMQEMYACVRSGILGEIELIRIAMRPWASQLATHFIDYALWANGGVGAEWVVGHVDGRLQLASGHPAPDYMMGEARLKNGVTLSIESGDLAPVAIPGADFWTSNRITVYGTNGYTWAETNGRCGFCTPKTGGKPEIKQYAGWEIAQQDIQTPYYRELADWLDDALPVESGTKKHSCNIETALEGYEIMEGIYKSALEHVRVDLPIQGEIKDYIAEMKKLVPEQKQAPDFKAC
jgi:predicted dehydrogenase